MDWVLDLAMDVGRGFCLMDLFHCFFFPRLLNGEKREGFSGDGSY